MTTLLTGENSFELQRALNGIRASFSGEVVTIDGADLELKTLPDLLMGVSLFSSKRMVVIKNLSENKLLWGGFADWLPRISDDVSLVLVEAKPDKRMVTYKELKKHADIHEFNAWTDRDGLKAEKWVAEEATRQNVVLDKKSIQHIIRRVGVDQWQLFYAIEKVSLIEKITPETIDDSIDAQPSENVFNLFETALRGDRVRLLDLLKTLELSQDPYALFGLLSSQVFQLAAVNVASGSDNVAKEFGIHPYVVSKLSSISMEKGKVGIRKIVNAFAKADDDLKTSRAEPWLLIESALLKIAS